MVRLDQQLLLDDLDLFLGVFLTVFLQVVDDLLAPAVLEYLFDHLRVLVGPNFRKSSCCTSIFRPKSARSPAAPAVRSRVFQRA